MWSRETSALVQLGCQFIFKNTNLIYDHWLRVDEVNSLKWDCQLQLGRGYPDDSMLKDDTGLQNYTICIHIGASFQCSLLTLMKLQLNLSNYDLGFRFCIHETTVSRLSSNGSNWCMFVFPLWFSVPWCGTKGYGGRVSITINSGYLDKMM